VFKRILVTGGAGFIGSNFIHFILKERKWDVVNLDALTYAGNLENLKQIEGDPRYSFIHGRIEDAKAVGRAMEGVDAVVHFAAESHVDRSIKDAQPFLVTNCLGTQVLLDMARSIGIKRFVHVSTDEVYGSLAPNDPPFTEEHLLRPNSPYAASKAGSDLLVRAAFRTHGIPVIITRCSNNYGPYQFPEKLIPLMILNAVKDRPLPVYGDGQNIRDWIHVEDHCSGLLKVLEQGRVGEVYNLGGQCEKTNLEVVEAILEILGRPRSLIQFVSDRPGHDRRYAMSIKKAQEELGWSPAISFEEGLKRTIQWYLDNSWWWERILSGEYRAYYKEYYGDRLQVV